jgi:phosphatidylcholine synthase
MAGTPLQTTTAHQVAAWGVHFYTATGLPLGAMGFYGLWTRDVALFFVAMWLATFVDATDGYFARRLRVKEVVPWFDGRRLDDIVDYLMFVFLPALGLPALGVLPGAWAPVCLVPILASAYGFSQEKAKTDDSFVGFPSYWNIIVVYLVVLGASPLVATVVLVALAVLVFVPIHYIYPSRTRFLRKWTVAFGVLWSVLLGLVCAWPEADWARPVAWGTLGYLVYYLFASLAHHRRVMAREAAA